MNFGNESLCFALVDLVRGNLEWFTLTQVICLKRCIHWDYVELLSRICVSVCVCMKEYWALSSQMSAEQSLCTITSGHLGPINTASSVTSSLSVIVSSSVSSLFSLSSTFLSIFLCITCLTYTYFCFSHPTPFSPLMYVWRGRGETKLWG